MRILGFMLENFMRVRLVEITPKGRVTIISGKNSQGKTSVMKGFFATLLGRRATPDEPVRKGSAKSTGKILIGGEDGRQLLITRTINKDRTSQLRVEPAKNGRPTGEKAYASPQDVLNDLVGEMALDPVEFIGYGQTKDGIRKQIEILRKIADVGEDFDQLNAEIKSSYDERTEITKTVKRLEMEATAITVQQGLPKAKIDEAAILKQLDNASASNKAARDIDEAKRNLFAQAGIAERALEMHRKEWDYKKAGIEELQDKLAALQAELKAHENGEEAIDMHFKHALEVAENAPAGEMVDVSALSAELQQAQLTNREIDKRERRDAYEKQLSEARQNEARLTRAIDDRKEQKVQALALAKMPVEGLLFDEDQVTFNGIPLGQLGEAEQLRISAEIMMAGNPKLRVLPIWRGEALDDDNLVMLGELAEKHDFYVLMLKVDSSGTCGIVMEDGEVKTVNEGAE